MGEQKYRYPLKDIQIQAWGHRVQVCGPITGHAVRDVAFCDNEIWAAQIVAALRVADAVEKLRSSGRMGNLGAFEIVDATAFNEAMASLTKAES